jgi:hypothetical protein
MKAPQKSLKKWSDQKWRTSDGTPSEGKKRYLPDKAWDALSASEKAATNKAKATGNKKGKQFVAQPKKVAEKVKRFRAAEGGAVMKKPMNEGMKALKKAAPAVAKKMGYKGGGQAMHRMPDGTMMKGAKHGYKHGGLVHSTGTLDTGIRKCGE